MQHRVIQELPFPYGSGILLPNSLTSSTATNHLINTNDKIRNWDCLLTEQSLLKFEPLYLINICSMLP